jgi:biopolymer transport protein ExbB/TolQ
MLYFIQSMGPFGILEIILLVVIAILAVKKTVDLFGRTHLDAPALENGLHAILFWGVIAAVLGVLGQVSGIYRALNVIINAKEIAPKLVAQGFAESFTTTIFGLTLFVAAAVIWFGLFARYKQLAASKS